MNTNANGLQDTGSDLQPNERTTVISGKGGKIRVPELRQIITGTPVLAAKDGMYVTFGGKFDAFCPNAELGDAQLGKPALFRVTSARNEEAVATLSRKQALAWEKVAEATTEVGPTFVKVLKVARKRHNNEVTGLSVEFAQGAATGLVAHIPYWETNRTDELNSLVGKVIAAVITEASPDKGGENGLLVASHNKAFAKNTTKAVHAVKTGEKLEGKIMKFIFADKKDKHPSALIYVTKLVEDKNSDTYQTEHVIYGLVPKSELPGYPNKLGTDTLKIGDTVTAQVLRINVNERRVVFGLRHEERAAYLSGIERGHVLVGQVSRILDFGVFIDLGHGIEGLLRNEDLRKVKGKREKLAVNDQVKIVVLQNDTVKSRLLLSRKALGAEGLAL